MWSRNSSGCINVSFHAAVERYVVFCVMTMLCYSFNHHLAVNFLLIVGCTKPLHKNLCLTHTPV